MKRQIIVANIYNENMLCDASLLTPTFRRFIALIAQRIAWFANPGDIVVLPSPLSPEMKRYLAKMNEQSDDADFAIVTPALGDDGPVPLGMAELLKPSLIAELRGKIGDDPWELSPYYYDRSAVALCRRLAGDEDAMFSPFVREGGAELLNDKRAFRSLAASAGVPIASGEICTSAEELGWAVRRLIDRTGAVIIKQDRNAGAGGNLIIGRSDLTGAQGAPTALQASDREALETAIQRAWETLSTHARAVLIVETYLPVEANLYAEFDLDPGYSRSTLLNWGEQRMAPTFDGFLIPPQTEADLVARFLDGAEALARQACNLGFQGLLDVDGIITDGGQVIYNEVNGRAGACSHIHAIMQRLVGRDYMERVAICAHIAIKSPAFEEVEQLLSDAGLAFCPATSEGIVVTAEDTARLGMLEFIAVAPTHDRARFLERQFADQLTVRARTHRDQRHAS